MEKRHMTSRVVNTSAYAICHYSGHRDHLERFGNILELLDDGWQISPDGGNDMCPVCYKRNFQRN